jgi:hypothetical protein
MEERNTTNTPGAPADDFAPRKLTLAENAILTLKVLGGFLLLGAGLWGISIWTSATP